MKVKCLRVKRRESRGRKEKRKVKVERERGGKE